MGKTSGRRRGLACEPLESRLAMAVVISEFVASNTDGLTDFAGDRPDWIELYNNDAGGPTVDIGGWYLSDDATVPTRWQIPAGTSLAGGERLVVFASGKDLVAPQLHTNFSLAASADDVVLTAADGTTVVDAFLDYLPQTANVAFGDGTDPGSTSSQTLVGASSPLSVISPTAENAGVDDYWMKPTFDDATWLTGTRSVGFDRDGTNNFGPFIGRVLSTTEMPSTGTPRYSAYVRYEFNVDDPAQLSSLSLAMRFDDGLIAYINGREVHRVNFGEDFARPQPQWDSRAGYQQGSSSSLSATNRGDEALTPVVFDLTDYLSLLNDGTNVLAFHVVNSASTSGTGSGQDLLLEPVLTATRTAGSATNYITTPTPGGANGVTTQGVVADTKFSVDRGFYTDPFSVAITTDTAGASIRYTLDGSEPSPTSGTLYTGPISITTTTILRAIAFQTGYVSSNVDTQTYIFLSDVITQSASDITQPYAPWGHDKEDSGSESGYNLDDESDWEMDPDIVNANIATIVADMQAIPSVSLVLDWDDLFNGSPLPGTTTSTTNSNPAPQGIYIHGTSSERAASLEFVNPSNPLDRFQADVAVETQGHSSTLRWNSDKLSLQVKFKAPFGESDLNYPLFSDSVDGDNSASEFDTLILDAGFNYAWHHNNPQQRDYARFVTDQVVSDLQNLASNGGQAPHGKYVHLYLNGLYWGVYNLHERPDDSFAAEYYGGNKDDYYAVKHANNDVNHEYTWVNGGVTAEQAFGSLVTATRAVESSGGSLATYQTVQNMLDVDQFINYMAVHYYAGNGADWSHNNWYATTKITGGLWRFHAWDQEHAFPTTDNGDVWDQNSDLTTKDDFEAPTELHRNLMASAEYRLRFADRVQQLMFNNGVLTPNAAQAVYEARTDEIDRAIVGESARWGDNRVATDPYTRADFVTTTQGVLSTFFPVRTGVVLNQFTAAGWLPTLTAPQLNQYGGEVASGFDAVLSLPAGAPGGSAIYYTLDGSDPRLSGGGIRPTAQLYSGPINLAESARIQARVFFDNTGTSNDWSPVTDETFVVPAPLPLRIVEVNYNPAAQPGIADEEDLEFLELLNFGSSTISLDGVQLGGFIAGGTYDLPSGITLDANERIIVARNPAVFTQVYGNEVDVVPLGYTANLGNSGEQITLLGPFGVLLQHFAYDDAAPWPIAADGAGYSLEYIGPFDNDPLDVSGTLGDPYDDAANWRASLALGGSPGTDGEPAPAIPGDYDQNGYVDVADHTVWQSEFGSTVTSGSGADGNADGLVDIADYTVWRDNLGAGTPPAAIVFAFSSAEASTAPAAQMLAAEDSASPDTITASRSLVRPSRGTREDVIAAAYRATDEAFAELSRPRHDEADVIGHQHRDERAASQQRPSRFANLRTPVRVSTRLTS